MSECLHGASRRALHSRERGSMQLKSRLSSHGSTTSCNRRPPSNNPPHTFHDRFSVRAHFPILLSPPLGVLAAEYPRDPAAEQLDETRAAKELRC
jgi:hypothetical protein